MTANTLAATVTDAFNRHGKFTAREVENHLAIEIRHADSGELATQLWIPDGFDGWMWQPAGCVGLSTAREMPRSAVIEDLVRSVATSVLDERPTR